MASPHRPRILVAGVGPVPPEAGGRLFAPGLRVWGFASELVRAGHPVRLATVRFSGEPLDRLHVRDLSPDAPPPDPFAPDRYELPSAREVRFATRSDPAGSDSGFSEALAREAEDFGAAAAIGSTDLINRELARASLPIPIWMDYFGDPMAERQMLARLHDSDGGLADQWSTLAPALRRADRLSGCSTMQCGSLLGEAATLGRLNRHTADEQLVHRLPPWIAPISAHGAGVASASDSAAPAPPPRVRGSLAPADAFLVVQTGGFNTWLDVETLFGSLELAMRDDPGVRFVATGGAIPGHDERSFAEFERRVAASPRRDRFHLLGWLPLPQVPQVIGECDLGLNVDRPSPEGWLGTRNRMLDWVLGGLPVVSTLGCELAGELAARWGEREADGAGETERASGPAIGASNPAPPVFLAPPQGDARAVADAILRCADLRRREPEAVRARVAAAAAWLRVERSPERCLAPLISWSRDPRPAGDLAAWAAGEPPPALWLGGGDASELAALEKARADAGEARARLATLEGSRLVRAAMRLRDAIGRMRR